MESLLTSHAHGSKGPRSCPLSSVPACPVVSQPADGVTWLHTRPAVLPLAGTASSPLSGTHQLEEVSLPHCSDNELRHSPSCGGRDHKPAASPPRGTSAAAAPRVSCARVAARGLWPARVAAGAQGKAPAFPRPREMRTCSPVFPSTPRNTRIGGTTLFCPVSVQAAEKSYKSRAPNTPGQQL